MSKSRIGDHRAECATCACVLEITDVQRMQGYAVMIDGPILIDDDGLDLHTPVAYEWRRYQIINKTPHGTWIVVNPDKAAIK